MAETPHINGEASTSTPQPDSYTSVPPILPSTSTSLDFNSESAFPTLGATAGYSTQGKGKKAVNGNLKAPSNLWSSGGGGAQRLAAVTSPNPSSGGLDSNLPTRPTTPGSTSAPGSVHMPNTRVPTTGFHDTLSLPTDSISIQPPPQKSAGRSTSSNQSHPNTLGEVLGKVMKSHSNVKIEASSSKTSGTTTFLFKGKSEDEVKKARKDLIAWVSKKVCSSLFALFVSLDRIVYERLR